MSDGPIPFFRLDTLAKQFDALVAIESDPWTLALHFDAENNWVIISQNHNKNWLRIPDHQTLKALALGLLDSAAEWEKEGHL